MESCTDLKLTRRRKVNLRNMYTSGKKCKSSRMILCKAKDFGMIPKTAKTSWIADNSPIAKLKS